MSDDPTPDLPEKKPETKIPEKILRRLEEAHSLPRAHTAQIDDPDQRGHSGPPARKFPAHIIGPVSAAGAETFLTQSRPEEHNGIALPTADREAFKGRIPDIQARIEKHGDAGRALFVLNERQQITEVYYGHLDTNSAASRFSMKIFSRELFDPGRPEPYYQAHNDKKPIAFLPLHTVGTYGLKNDGKNTYFLGAIRKRQGDAPREWYVNAYSKYADGHNKQWKPYTVVDPVTPAMFRKRSAYATLSDDIKEKVDDHLRQIKRDGITEPRVVAVLGRINSTSASADYVTTNLYIGGKGKDGKEQWSTIDCVPRPRTTSEFIDCGSLVVPKKHFSSHDNAQKFINSLEALPRDARLSLAPTPLPEDPMALAVAQFKNPAHTPAEPENYQSHYSGVGKGKTPNGTGIV